MKFTEGAPASNADLKVKLYCLELRGHLTAKC